MQLLLQLLKGMVPPFSSACFVVQLHADHLRFLLTILLQSLCRPCYPPSYPDAASTPEEIILVCSVCALLDGALHSAATCVIFFCLKKTPSFFKGFLHCTPARSEISHCKTRSLISSQKEVLTFGDWCRADASVARLILCAVTYCWKDISAHVSGFGLLLQVVVSMRNKTFVAQMLAYAENSIESAFFQWDVVPFWG